MGHPLGSTGNTDALCHERRPRKGHKKSTQGCLECKRRKIKCQEKRPRCDNCARLSLRCRYLPEAAAIATRLPAHRMSSLHIANVFSLTDMRLFHHFLVAAFPHFPVRPDNIWLSYITPIGHQCEYLMHAMLALSASHLRKISPTPSCLSGPAQTHRLAAMKGLNEALSRPVCSSEEADAAIAACYALLMQSWYMDDGLQASLVLTRSCEWTTKWVRKQNVKSILAEEDEFTKLAIMRGRFKDAPRFDVGFAEKAVASVQALESLCIEEVQVQVLTGLKKTFELLHVSPIAAYDACIKMDSLITQLEHTAFLQLLETNNEASQLLLAHLVALQLIMRPISCRERKHYTVTMYGIRMSTWIPGIYNSIPDEMRYLMEWPMWVSRLHGEGGLEKWSLAIA
ncbi:hypothetical protein N431DRAFT_505051 [Stipitochalara longipes BDJ]|nr:hypothetical protein N431DRAFT_505051 [Stipitochalara longipes BDJ]